MEQFLRERCDARVHMLAVALVLGITLGLPSAAQANLKSNLFRGDKQLEAAAVSNPAHIVPGAVGPHVGKIQQALIEIQGASIDPAELRAQRYGPSTAKTVLAYKQKREIINRSYQTEADNVVGIMTMASLDSEMYAREHAIQPHEVLGPPLIDPVPGFDATAPDGFVIPIPRQIRRPNGTSQLLDHATVNVSKSGGIYVMVVDNLGPPSHPHAQDAAKATAQAAAKRAVDRALRFKPDVTEGWLAFGVGRIAGGLVSVVASVIDPSPMAKEVHWGAVVSGKPVRYVVLTSP